MDASVRLSPFVNAESFESNGNGLHLDEAPTVNSPFIHAYVVETEDASDTGSEARQFLMGELEDDELEGAIYELAGSAAEATRHVDGAAAGMATLELKFAPLAREIDAMLARTGERLGHRDVSTLSEGELDEALAERSTTALEPPMEQFLDGIRRVVKKAVSGAANLAKKGLAAAASLGLMPIIDRIRKALPKLLRRIITGIINRLPASLQADAKKTRRRAPDSERVRAGGG